MLASLHVVCPYEVKNFEIKSQSDAKKVKLFIFKLRLFPHNFDFSITMY